MSDHGYGGVFGAFPYAFRRSDSWLFRSYVVAGGLLAALLTVFFMFAVVGVIAGTVGAGEGTITFVRSIFVMLGLFVVAPLIAPVLFVARRHRRTGSDSRYDAALATTGYLFVLSAYAGAVVSMPPEFTLDGETVTRPEPSGLATPFVEALYLVPATLSWTIPLAGALVIYLTHRRLR